MASRETSSNRVQPSGSRKRPRASKGSIEQTNASCMRCREKKIKCDTEIPVCRPCSKAGSTCVIVDSSTGKEYTRGQIQSLHEQIQDLEEHLQARGVELDQPQRLESNNLSSHINNVPQNTQIRHIPKFIGDESGTGFTQYILHAISRGWKDASFPQPIQGTLSGPAVIDHPAHALPSSSEGAKLITAYLTGFHIQHTFLQRSRVQSLYQNVYQRRSPARQLPVGELLDEKYELFQLNLIFALANIDPYRKGQSDKHPFGYFTAGLQNLNGVMSFETIRDVQGFLLIAHFGLYYYIGCSIWEICQICLRICIEQGLHNESRNPPQNLLMEQMRRRVFWDCYQLDTLSSVTLGRPFGIEDSDIEIGLPFDAEDEYLEQLTHWSSNDISSLSGLSSSNGEVAVFNCCIQLGRIACRIHTSLNLGFPEESSQRRKAPVCTSTHRNGFLEPGDTYQLFREFFSELRAWRLSCPMFMNPQCPAQTQEWFQFMYEREKLTLVRAVIDRVNSRATFPPKELLNPCHNTAVAIIHRYDDLRKRGQVTYSWSYMQLLLSCGLSVVFCVFVKLDHRRKDSSRLERSWLSHRWTDVEPETFREFSLQESSLAIDACAEIHSWMAEQSKEMARYARFFDMMRRGIQEKIKQGEIRSSPIAQVPTSGSGLEGDHDAEMGGCLPPNYSSSQSHQIRQAHHLSTNINTNPGMGQERQFSNSEYVARHQNEPMPHEGLDALGPTFSQQLQYDWPMNSTDSENTFEPLVRQLFGIDSAFDFQGIDFSTLPSNFSTWEFPQDPLLAEFTSGLEGFM